MMMDGNPGVQRHGGRPWKRYTARALALLWAGWWSYFGLASGIGEGLDPLGIAIHTAVPGLIFLLLTVVAWRWEAIGGAVLLLLGLLFVLWFPLREGGGESVPAVVFMLLTMGIPPLVSGALFLLSWLSSRR